jgi:hypothetical protein
MSRRRRFNYALYTEILRCNKTSVIHSSMSRTEKIVSQIKVNVTVTSSRDKAIGACYGKKLIYLSVMKIFRPSVAVA